MFRILTGDQADNLGGPFDIDNDTTVFKAIFGGSASETFELAVRPVNDLPILSALADISIAEDTPSGEMAFTVDDVETPAEQLEVKATSSNSALIPEDQVHIGGEGRHRVLTVSPAPNQSGAAEITLAVRASARRCKS